MQYRNDRAGEAISMLGFGCMRFERKGNGIDYDKAEAQIMRAKELGVNYFDTAYLYPGSEEVLGRVLEQNACREEVRIATKLPQYLVRRPQAFDRYFDEELKLAEWGKVDTIGHLTYPLRYICGEHGRKVDLRDYSGQIVDVLRAIIHSGIALEINTSGLFQKIESTMPPEEIVAQYRRLGGELITIGSDAHYAEHLGRGIADGMALAKRCGFSNLTIFEHREPIQIPIE